MREGKRADAHSGVSEAVGRGPRRTRRAAASSRPSSPPATAAPACWPPGPAAQRSPGSRSGSGSPGSAGWPSVLTSWNATKGWGTQRRPAKKCDTKKTQKKQNCKLHVKILQGLSWDIHCIVHCIEHCTLHFSWTEKTSHPLGNFSFHNKNIQSVYQKSF